MPRFVDTIMRQGAQANNVIDLRREREAEANRQLADAAHQCAERLRCITAYLDRQIDELDLPAQQHSLAAIGAALLRIEREAQHQLPWLCRDGGGRR